jgi:hypothetical protein
MFPPEISVSVRFAKLATILKSADALKLKKNKIEDITFNISRYTHEFYTMMKQYHKPFFFFL